MQLTNDHDTVHYLAYKAYQLRKLSLIATSYAGSGHLTSCLSAADIVAVLFFNTMQFDPCNPKNQTNDRFILSKGHAAPLVYAAWTELGIISEEDLQQLRTINSPLEGHPTARFAHNDASTGSLGNGLSIALGYALSGRLDGHDFYTYVLLGDSEVAEGSIWEAAEIGSYYQLNKVIAFLDCNRLGQTTQTMVGYSTEKYAARFTAFGWHTIVIDGHDIAQIINAITHAKQIPDRPSIIIAKTIKGYGLPSCENKEGFHGKAFPLTQLADLLTTVAQRFPEQAQYEKTHPDAHKKPLACEKQPPHTPAPAFTLPPPEYAADVPVATRFAYGQALTAVGGLSTAVVALDAEVKNSTYAEIFEKKYPQRFFQCFIAEQNMVNMAVGFARTGKIPFVSTFAAFFTRAHDQIRMAAIDQAHICLVGSHAGVSVGQDGPSQMGLEDIALMRSIPGSTVVYPCDAVSTYQLTAQIAQNSGINYLRTTRNATPILYSPHEQFPIGGCKIVKQNQNDTLCIIAAGITVFEAIKAHETLLNQGVYSTVIDCYSIKPLDAQTLSMYAHKAGSKIITVEDHYPEGGLGEAISYALRNEKCTFSCLAVDRLPRSGSSSDLMSYENIDAAAIVRTAITLVEK